MLNAMISAPQGGVSIANDLNSGFLSKLMLTQVSRPAILLGRLLTDVFVVVVQSAMTIVVAIAMGVTIATGIPGILLMLVTAAFFELALSGIFLVVGMKRRKTETISAISGVLFFPLIFVSSAVFPTSFFPAWAQTVSKYNPVSYASNVTRELVQGGLTLSTIVSAYTVIGLIATCNLCGDIVSVQKSRQLRGQRKKIKVNTQPEYEKLTKFSENKRVLFFLENVYGGPAGI